MFGFGSMFIDSSKPPGASSLGGAVSASLFTTNSIQFVETLPSELARYSGDVNTATLGLQLNLVTQSFDASAPIAISTPDIGFDDGTSGGGTSTGTTGGGLK